MNRRAFLAAAALLAPAAGWAQGLPSAEAFEAWVARAEAGAAQAGVRSATIAAARQGLALNPSLVRPAGADSESRRVGRYVQSLISGDGQRARAKRAANPRLSEIEARFAVPASVLVAFWGRESSYGADFGKLDVFSTLATLGASGRGTTDWTGEYLAALRILETGVKPREQLRGSAAGALGHTQLMPTSYLTYGEDFDGDGRIDVWSTSPLDALASAARHIQKAPAANGPLRADAGAWLRGASWIAPVTLPAAFDLSRIEVEETRLAPPAWAAMGVRMTEPLRPGDERLEARLVLPAGIDGPALLLFPNFDVFESYNSSRTYALGVGLLARHIEGLAPVAWPEETPLSLDDRQAAQRTLSALGLYGGPIDGDLGSGSRRAIRALQRARHVPADGYLTTDLVAALKG